MRIHRRHHAPLGHASTIVACERTGAGLLVDPGRTIEPLLDVIERERIDLVHVADTHGHNDYLSGAVAVAQATGARPLAPVGSIVGYDAEAPAGRDVIELGDLRVTVLHTPGHTPEHTAFLVEDEGTSERVLLTGGSLLIGDVGRPDLLGSSVDIADAATQSRATILDVILPLGDDVRVIPTHVEGSLCGGSIGPGLETTIGEERRTNPVVDAMLVEAAGGEAWFDPAALPVVPRYWRRMRSANVAGVPAWRCSAGPATRVSGAVAADVLATGMVAVDSRPAAVFTGGHLPGSVNVPAGASLPTWLGTVLDANEPWVLVAHGEDVLVDVVEATAWIGVEPPVAWIRDRDLTTVPGVEKVGLSVLDVVTSEDALERVRLGEAVLVDVRHAAEVTAHHYEHAVHVAAGAAIEQPTLVPPGPVVLACRSGLRASIVASILVATGRSATSIVLDASGLVGGEAPVLAAGTSA